MKSGLPLLAICLFLALLMAASPTTKNAIAPLSLTDLNDRPVIGKLDLPLGTPAEIEATLVNGRELMVKAYADTYLLRVVTVNGSKLKDPPLMEFFAPTYTGVDLPNEAFGLYELKTGSKPHSLSSEQISKLEKGYIGTTVRLLVYETGGFSGRPNLPREVPQWQDHGFSFSTSLRVMIKRK